MFPKQARVALNHGKQSNNVHCNLASPMRIPVFLVYFSISNNLSKGKQFCLFNVTSLFFVVSKLTNFLTIVHNSEEQILVHCNGNVWRESDDSTKLA